MKASVRVTRTGQVASVEILSDSLGVPEVTSCVKEMLSNPFTDTPPRGGCTVFVLPLHFESAPVEASEADVEGEATDADAGPSTGVIVGYGALGLVASVIGGHAVGEFADILVEALNEAGYSEMVGALILSVFAAAGAFAMIITAHAKGMYDIALAAASGQITQVPFVVLPVAMILLGVFAVTGVVPTMDHGGVLVIDLETTSVLLLAFPTMLILWKAIQDDGKVNWVETASMVCVFALVVYFLARHG